MKFKINNNEIKIKLKKNMTDYVNGIKDMRINVLYGVRFQPGYLHF